MVVCLVVGMGTGIGMSVAQRFAREGFRIAMIARRQNALDEYTAALGTERASGFAADISDESALRAALQQVSTTVGDPSVLVYNAAMIEPGAPSTLDPAQLAASFRVNVIGALICAQHCLASMQAAKSGTILLTGGGLALRPNPQYAGLAIGKSGLRSLAYSLGMELEPQGIHVATVTVAGFVQSGTFFDPDRIADDYWRLHTQPVGSWETEVVYRQP